MRNDQLENLEALGELLADLVVAEADPTQWPGCGKPAAAMSREERAEREWWQKNAAATIGLAMKVQALLEKSWKPARKPDTLDETFVREIGMAQKEVERIMGRQ